MEYIIIKHYAGDIDGDYHDLVISEYERIYKELESFARECGRKLFYAPIAKEAGCSIPLDTTPFAEVEYTGELAAEERERYVEFLKRLSRDARFERGYLIPYGTLKMVKFKRIADEDIYEVSYKKCPKRLRL